MSKLTYGRYNGDNNTGEGNGIHKDVLLEEAKNAGFKGLQKATKNELADLLYGERTEEEDQILYKKIKDRIKGEKKIIKENTNVLEMNLNEADLKIIEEVNSFQHDRVGRYYDETFNSNYPEVNHIENRLKYDENGLERNFSPSKKQLKWCEEKKKDFIDYVNSEYDMNWDSFYDILTWAAGNGDDFAPRNKDNVDIILGCEKRKIANERRKEMKERSIMLLNNRLLDDITKNPDGIEV
jgi:hypothetical protein